VTYEI